MQQDWNLLLSPEAYSRCDRDMPGYEAIIEGLSESGFPHELSRISKKRLSAFKTTPFAATHTFDMARAAIQGEQLGGGAETDFLSISISSTDYIGHAFGPNSLEVQDAYLRLDRDLSAFLQYLDKRLGRGNYLFFLTADHGVSQIPDWTAPSAWLRITRFTWPICRMKRKRLYTVRFKRNSPDSRLFPMPSG
jgi:predicted AlkP superfamily pyrophosphatase or phosphodiesterase